MLKMRQFSSVRGREKVVLGSPSELKDQEDNVLCEFLSLKCGTMFEWEFIHIFWKWKMGMLCLALLLALLIYLHALLGLSLPLLCFIASWGVSMEMEMQGKITFRNL